MDAAGIDMACLVPHRQAVYMNVDPRGPSMSWMIDACAKYPDRLIPAPVFEPSTRGVENAIWELEYMAKEHGCKYGNNHSMAWPGVCIILDPFPSR
jgi:predicted TIM-barrel fold metal-dependent hydrolase